MNIPPLAWLGSGCGFPFSSSFSRYHVMHHGFPPPSPFLPPFLSPKPENCLSALCRRAKKSVMLGLLLSVGVFDWRMDGRNNTLSLLLTKIRNNNKTWHFCLRFSPPSTMVAKYGSLPRGGTGKGEGGGGGRLNIPRHAQTVSGLLLLLLLHFWFPYGIHQRQEAIPKFRCL